VTVRELIVLLEAMPADWELACQGTSIAVTPTSVAKLSEMRARDNADQAETWSYGSRPDETVVILTDG